MYMCVTVYAFILSVVTQCKYLWYSIHVDGTADNVTKRKEQSHSIEEETNVQSKPSDTTQMLQSKGYSYQV